MQTKTWNAIAHKVAFNLDIDLSGFENRVPPDTAVLDYGCGYGRTCNILKNHGYHNTVGSDSSPEMIKRGHVEYPHLSLYQNKRITLEYPDRYFGAIILCAVLTCVPEYHDKVRIISEISRLLKKDGILHIVEFCSNTGKTYESGLGVVMNHQQPDTFRTMVGEFMDELKFDVLPVKTMSGHSAEAMSYFGQKII